MFSPTLFAPQVANNERRFSTSAVVAIQNQRKGERRLQPTTVRPRAFWLLES